jgi:hypothetical protein
MADTGLGILAYIPKMPDDRSTTLARLGDERDAGSKRPGPERDHRPGTRPTIGP